MKAYILNHVLVYSLILLVAGSCAKPKDLTPLGSAGVPVNTTNPTQTFDSTGRQLVASGTFRNGVHTVSGTVKLYEKSGKQTLVFTNFATDGGPDLRIYLAADTQAGNFTEVQRLTTTGNFYVDLTTPLRLDQQRFVLIWCKQFSVHFGNAELKQ
nr:DM13 domain-containing protein [uncultured Arsenicibacter sp.]